MAAKLIIDNDNQLREITEVHPPRSGVLRVIARVISFIFHPVFLPVYIVLFLLFIHPFVFAGFDLKKKILVLAQAVLMYTIFPLVTVLLLRALGFVKSVYLHTTRDRIIPYAACMIWYFWIWYVWRNLPDSPREIITLSLAIFLASLAGWMGNIFIKISMHAISMGVMLGYGILLGLTEPVSFGAYLSIAFLAAGVVCTARFIASNHTPKEIYSGLISGILVTVIAAGFS